ncbi:U-box domain-containing protein 52 [Camellia lanceoleosa]|uniref:U-box domain-containing protein 52 n=1 Tax=Camellia lanceoleosa TaxID=1840588 RepID=A0ACC0ITH8_9ERIC|nr:U-box domain-containing protein 52 [Camellia lanceoleosa]
MSVWATDFLEGYHGRALCCQLDGYAYDRKAVRTWLEENDKSPMTNLPLPTRNLIPNYTLLSAISEWKSGKQ